MAFEAAQAELDAFLPEHRTLLFGPPMKTIEPEDDASEKRSHSYSYSDDDGGDGGDGGDVMDEQLAREERELEEAEAEMEKRAKAHTFLGFSTHHETEEEKRERLKLERRRKRQERRRERQAERNRQKEREGIVVNVKPGPLGVRWAPASDDGTGAVIESFVSVEGEDVPSLSAEEQLYEGLALVAVNDVKVGAMAHDEVLKRLDGLSSK